MTAINIPTKEAIAQTEQSAKELLEKTLKNRAASIIEELLMPPGNWNRREGALHSLLRSKIEAYVLSDEYDAVVERVIREKANEATEEALSALMRSESRKAFFLAAKAAKAEA